MFESTTISLLQFSVISKINRMSKSFIIFLKYGLSGSWDICIARRDPHIYRFYAIPTLKLSQIRKFQFHINRSKFELHKNKWHLHRILLFILFITVHDTIHFDKVIIFLYHFIKIAYS